MNDVPETQLETTPETAHQSRLAVRLLGLAMIITAVLIVWYAIIVYIGYQQGQTLLQEKRITTLTSQIDTQLHLAQQNINDGQYKLARTRLNWVLERAPNNAQAPLLFADIDSRLNVTPTVVNAATATATAVPLPTPTPGLIGDPDAELTRIQRLIKNEKWEDVISALITYQLQYPSYNREITDRLLYDAYITQGLAIIEGDQVELGLAYFSEAEKLGDLPQEVRDYRFWAELYMFGIAYYGVNWDIAASNFRELCRSAPFYQDSCNLLQQSLVRAGDQFAFGLDWCPAESYYAEAASYGADSILTNSLGQARANCAAATPIPSDVFTNTVGITNTETITEP